MGIRGYRIKFDRSAAPHRNRNVSSGEIRNAIMPSRGVKSFRNLLWCPQSWSPPVPRSACPVLRFSARSAFLGALAATLALGACGRKGPLDPPPAASLQEPAAQSQPGSGEAQSPSAAVPIEYRTDGRPLAPRGQKRKLPADWLID
jgi:predicted small lipoprotein YifL